MKMFRTSGSKAPQFVTTSRSFMLQPTPPPRVGLLYYVKGELVDFRDRKDDVEKKKSCCRKYIHT
jgi:hypothetical protein